MRVDEARLLLGVGPDATLDDAKQAYLRRAKLIHPDRHQEPSAHAEAEAAMSQLNQAWQTFQAPVPHEPVGPVLRGASAGECSLCGTAPARLLKMRVNVAWVIWFTRHSIDQVLCAGCGLAMAREAQGRTMIRGWWGPFSALSNIFNLVGNGRAIQQAKELQPYQRTRDPAVVTPFPSPIPSKPLGSRPLPWLATIAAVAIVAALVGNAIVQANKDPYVGACYNSSSAVVSCSDASAVVKVVAHLQRGSECPAGDGSATLDDQTVICGVAWP